MRRGGTGIIEDGLLKGRKFMIPAEVLVEKGDLGGATQYAMACLIHEEFIPNGGCFKCKEEVKAIQERQPKNQEIPAGS